MDKNSNNNENNNDDQPPDNDNKKNSINWDGIWPMPDWTINEPFSFNSPTGMNADKNPFVWDLSHNFGSARGNTLNNLLEALEEAIDANLENNYLNSKVIDLYSKYSDKD